MTNQGLQQTKELYPERVTEFRGEEMTEIKAMRLKYQVTSTELATELGLKGAGVYSLHENGKRNYKEDRYEEFYYEVCQALHRIERRRKEETNEETLTAEKFKEVLLMMAKGRSIIYASIHHGLDYEVVTKEYTRLVNSQDDTTGLKKLISLIPSDVITYIDDLTEETELADSEELA